MTGDRDPQEETAEDSRLLGEQNRFFYFGQARLDMNRRPPEAHSRQESNTIHNINWLPGSFLCVTINRSDAQPNDANLTQAKSRNLRLKIEKSAKLALNCKNIAQYCTREDGNALNSI